jgi:thiamine pyrophosphokinase
VTGVRRAVVLADGDAPSREQLDASWPGWDNELDLVVAADGGARLADGLGLRLDRWVGDGDSLGSDGVAELRRRGVSVSLEPVEKGATDTELALEAALEAGAASVVIIGALGGPRPDHALANIALLGHPGAAGRDLVILDPSARVRLLAGPGSELALPGRIGALVSLIPVETVTGVTTTGLQFGLSNATLEAGRSRGVSNVRVDPRASVSIGTGRLLVVEAPARLSE